MPTISLSPLHHVLSLVDHGSAAREHSMYGGALGQRMLNVTGRWAARGTAAAPLLVWPSLEAARVDADQATAARGRPVAVSQAGGTGFDRFIASFGPQHASALIGYLPYSIAAARKLEIERQRLMGYANVVLAADVDAPTDDPEAAVIAMKASARNLRQAGIGNGSWVSAVQGLTGNRALDVAARVVDGELACDPGITPAGILKAMAIAEFLASKS